VSIANYFTLSRIVISPIFLIVYMWHDFFGISSTILPFVLLSLLGISELSDALDGYMARRYNQVTDLGKILDPMADSIARISIFLTFTLDPVNLPMLLVFAFLYRDSIISTLRTICALKGFALAARMSGKTKAVIQALAAFMILVLMIPHSMGDLSTAALQQISFWVVSVAAVYTLYSGIDYLYVNKHYIAKSLTFQTAKDTQKI